MTIDTIRPDLTGALGEVSAKVEAAMHADLNQSLAGSNDLLREVVNYALFGGGKRIRPFLCVQASRCCGRDDTTLYTLAAAIEYLHTATLMHDDVVDHAPLRRGRQTTAKRYSLEDAILAGDWLHTRSLYMVGKLTGVDGLDSFCAATAAMVNGEFVQKRLSGNCRATEEEYFAVIEQKTGNLIAWPARWAQSMPVQNRHKKRHYNSMVSRSALPSRLWTTCLIIQPGKSKLVRKWAMISRRVR